MKALKAMLFLSKADTEAIVAETKVRSLVVMGTRDIDFASPAAEANWLADALGSEVVLVDGAGHYPHTEMPDIVTPKVLSFLENLYGRQAHG